MDTNNLQSGFYYLKSLEEYIDKPKGTITIARYTKYETGDDGELNSYPWEHVASDNIFKHKETLEDYEILGPVPQFLFPCDKDPDYSD